jgi:hypothetical protein
VDSVRLALDQKRDAGFLPQIVRSPRWMASRSWLVKSDHARAVSMTAMRAATSGPMRGVGDQSWPWRLKSKASPLSSS